MTRHELVELRKELVSEATKRKALGEFDANSFTILMLLRTCLQLTDHTLERTRK